LCFYKTNGSQATTIFSDWPAGHYVAVIRHNAYVTTQKPTSRNNFSKEKQPKKSQIEIFCLLLHFEFVGQKTEKYH